MTLIGTESNVIAALANGTLAIISKKDDAWSFSNVKMIDFGAPHHAIGCATFVKQTGMLWCGYRNEIKMVEISQKFELVKTLEVRVSLFGTNRYNDYEVKV